MKFSQYCVLVESTVLVTTLVHASPVQSEHTAVLKWRIVPVVETQNTGGRIMLNLCQPLSASVSTSICNCNISY